MSWSWRNINTCEVAELTDQLNRQMKGLENDLGKGRPFMMAGFPDAVGAVVSNTTVTVGATTDETDLKSTLIERGTIGSKGGFRVRAAGKCDTGGGIKTIKLYFGGVEIGSFEVASGTHEWLLDAEFWNADDTQEQKVMIKAWEDTTMEVMDVTESSVDTL